MDHLAEKNPEPLNWRIGAASQSIKKKKKSFSLSSEEAFHYLKYLLQCVAKCK